MLQLGPCPPSWSSGWFERLKNHLEGRRFGGREGSSVRLWVVQVLMVTPPAVPWEQLGLGSLWAELHLSDPRVMGTRSGSHLGAVLCHGCLATAQGGCEH